MKKAVLLESGDIRLEVASIPNPLPHEVLVKVRRVGICGSDINFYRALPSSAKYPVVQGHEVGGEVVYPNGSRRLKKGDRVAVFPAISCRQCEWCDQGLPNHCEDLKILGITTEGCAQEYICAPKYNVLLLPEDMSYDTAAMLEPLSTGVHACNMAGDLTGKNVLVVGAGMMGNVTAQAAKAKGAAKVMISGRSQYRLDFAKKVGIEYCVNEVKEDLETAVQKEFGAYADVVFECIGVSSSINAAVKNVKVGGLVVIVSRYDNKQPVNFSLIQAKEIHITGSKTSNPADAEEALSLVTGGKVDLNPLITKHFPLSKFKEAYEHIAFKSNHVMKVMLDV